jgi:hypothetical protein
VEVADNVTFSDECTGQVAACIPKIVETLEGDLKET